MSISTVKKGILIEKKGSSRITVTWQNTFNNILPPLLDMTLRIFSFSWSFVWFYLYIPTSMFFFEMAWRFYSEAPFSLITISVSLILTVIALLLILHPIDIILHAIVIVFTFIMKKR